MARNLWVVLSGALVLSSPAMSQTPPQPPPTTPPTSPQATPPQTVVGQPSIAASPVLALGECDVAAPTGGFWASADYQVVWLRGTNLPFLVTTSTAGTPRGVAAILGQPSTKLLFGGQVNDNARSGWRLESGYSFGQNDIMGIEAGFSMLESQSTIYAESFGAGSIAGRPFTNARTGSPQAVLVAFPGSSTGAIDIRAQSGNFYEFHFDFSEKLVDTSWLRMDTLLGYRMYRYDETLRMNQTVSPSDPAFVAGTRIISVDDFGSQNEFHGGEIGLRAKLLMDAWTWSFLGKIAAGRLGREVNIVGNQITSVPGTPSSTQTGGVYALTSNIGRYHSHDWATLPEFGTTVGWKVRPNVELRFGYTLLYLDRVARAGDQIDQTINTDLFPPATIGSTPARPAFDLKRKDVWIQTLNFGMEVRF